MYGSHIIIGQDKIPAEGKAIEGSPCLGRRSGRSVEKPVLVIPYPGVHRGSTIEADIGRRSRCAFEIDRSRCSSDARCGIVGWAGRTLLRVAVLRALFKVLNRNDVQF